LISAKSAVTVLRSPSIAAEASGSFDTTRISEVVDADSDDREAAEEVFADSLVPQSPQNLDVCEFSAPHFGQSAGSSLPHCAQNFFPTGFSVPHFEQRISCHLSITVAERIVNQVENSSSSAFASFRSMVSKPSVNQP
jgi:hypothetical protein